MAPYVPEEVDVFSVPHSRMKELVNNYYSLMQSTNFTDILDLQQLLESLSRTFREFKTHEQIENRFIMKRLKLKMKKLSIRNSAVCNCHKDHAVTDMMMLLQDGYKKKTDQDRLNYGLQLKQALEDFTQNFLPHMKEEEEVFQPLLLQFFSYEELCELKQKVIQQHLEQELEKFERSHWTHDSKEHESTTSCSSDSETDELKLHELLSSPKIRDRLRKKLSAEKQYQQRSTESLPPELLLNILQFLDPRDLSRCMQVSSRWSKLAADPSLWKTFLPMQWSKGDWSFTSKQTEEDSERLFNDDDEVITLDDDADIDETMDDAYSQMLQQVRNEVRMLTGVTEHILPRVGVGVQTLNLANCRTLTNGMLHRILVLCPNLEHLDLSQTRITDAGLRRLGKNGCGTKLKTLNLSGCQNITDATLVRLAMALSDIDSIHGNKPEVEVEAETVSVECHTSEVDRECLCEQYYDRCHQSLGEEKVEESCSCDEPAALERLADLPTNGCGNEESDSCDKCDKERQKPRYDICAGRRCGRNQEPTNVSHDPVKKAVEKQEIEENYDKNHAKIYNSVAFSPSADVASDDNPPGDSTERLELPSMLHDSNNRLKPSPEESLQCHSACQPRAADEVDPLEECSRHRRDLKNPAPRNIVQVSEESTLPRKCCKKKKAHRIRELRVLNLSGCFQVTDVGLRALARCGRFPHLHCLDLSGCFHLTADSLHEMVASSPALCADDLYYCDNIIDGPFADIASGCRNLQCTNRVCCRSGD